LALTPALARYEAYPDQGRECDGEIDRRLQALTPVWSAELPPLDRADKHRTPHKPAPTDEARRLLSQWVGVDLSAIPGLPARTVPTLLSELGLALPKWPKMKAFCAWFGVAPRHAISGGTSWRRSTLKPRNRAGQAVRLAAQAVRRSHNRWGAYDRRMRARLGPQAALVATAHTRARLVYHLLTQRTPYRDRSAEDYEQQARQRELVTRRKQAATLGLALVQSPP
jgi:transposase